MALFAPDPAPAPAPPREDAGASRPRLCGECGNPLVRAIGKRNIFCSAPCRVAYSNRMTVRGRVLTAAAMAERMTRQGSRGTPRQRGAGKDAARIYRQLIDQFAAEDRAAGRISAVDYWAARLTLGYER